jgi:hypothetical protein
MKSRISILLATTVAFILGTSLLLHSQTQITTLFKVQVPFDFRVGNSHLSAGQYTVFHVGSRLIMLQRSNGTAIGLTPVMVSSTAGDKSATKLVFNHYGNQYFLSQVWTEVDSQRHDCFPPRSERILWASQRLAGTVTVMAKR